MAQHVCMCIGGRPGNKPPSAEKAAIARRSLREADCEGAAAAVSSQGASLGMFNYPVAIEGNWLGNKYRFFTRYRADDPASPKAEFDAPFARLDYVSQDCFDLMWRRHTGKWHCVSERLSLTEALHWIEREPHFQPC